MFYNKINIINNRNNNNMHLNNSNNNFCTKHQHKQQHYQKQQLSYILLSQKQKKNFVMEIRLRVLRVLVFLWKQIKTKQINASCTNTTNSDNNNS